ncbi:MarR family transcriptional regulator [Alicyclobacillus pomorum]
MDTHVMRETCAELAYQLLILQQNLATTLAKEGFTRNQLFVLSYLSRRDTAKIGDIARAADMSPSTITALCDELEAKHLVQRHRSKSDRRVVYVTLTEDGKRKLEMVREQRVNQMMEMFAPFDPHQLETTVEFVKGLNSVYKTLVLPENT